MSNVFEHSLLDDELESGETGSASDGLAAKVVRGGTVLLGGQILIRIIRIVSLAILGRLLAPADYGIFALALVVTGLVEVISDLQVGAAIVRLREVQDSHFHTAFTIALLRGLGIAAIIFLTAVPAAELMRQPALVTVFHWLALGPLIGGMANARFILLEKELNFVAEVKIIVASTLVGTAITIALALVLRNYWALVFGSLASIFVNVTLPYLFVAYSPRLSLAHWRDFVGFGGWLTGANILSYLNYRSDTFLVGSMLSPTVLGYYSMGDRVAQLTTNELAQPFARTFYPGLAAVAHDPARLRSAYYKSQQVVMALVLPFGVGAAICAKQIIIIFAGSKWLPAAPVVMFVAPVMAIGIMNAPVQALSMTVGNTRSLFVRSLGNLILRVPLIFGGLYFGGLIGLLTARSFTGTIFNLSTLQLAKQYTGDGFFEPFIRGYRSLVGCLVMAVVLLGFRALMPVPSDNVLNAIVSLTEMSALGLATYLMVHISVWHVTGHPDGAERLIVEQLRHIWRKHSVT
jgi:O-antigen/teichoic acid export membrane protein